MTAQNTLATAMQRTGNILITAYQEMESTTHIVLESGEKSYITEIF